MEKRKPTYDLTAVKAAFSVLDYSRITGAALNDAAALGFDPVEIINRIQVIERKHFYKSMTSYRDHRIWQDVYHVPSRAGLLYVKFTVNSDGGYRLLSFKEAGND